MNPPTRDLRPSRSRGIPQQPSPHHGSGYPSRTHHRYGPTTALGSRRKKRKRLRHTFAALVVAATAVIAATAAVDRLNRAEAGPGNGTGTAKPKRSPAALPATPSASPDPDSIPVPASGPGTFATAASTGEMHGKGTVRRYQVQVEHGIKLSAENTAQEISAVLAHPRGWTRNGTDAFQLVSSDYSGPVDFVVKIATPGTVDSICGAAGLDTHGEVNCSVGETVVVNLKRWVLGSPQFDGPVSEYRALIINHEVGHRIGHGHMTCPGPGKPAPAMMQQIKGLKGCRSNAWPYTEDGTYLSGPRVP